MPSPPKRFVGQKLSKCLQTSPNMRGDAKKTISGRLNATKFLIAMLIVKLLLMLTSLQMLLATHGGLICNLNAIGATMK